MGRGLFLGQPYPTPQGSVAPADHNFGVLPYLCVHGVSYSKFGVVTHMGMGVF